MSRIDVTHAIAQPITHTTRACFAAQIASPTKTLFQLANIFLILMVPGRASCAYVYEDVMGVMAILCTAPYFLFFCRYVHVWPGVCVLPFFSDLDQSRSCANLCACITRFFVFAFLTILKHKYCDISRHEVHNVTLVSIWPLCNCSGFRKVGPFVVMIYKMIRTDLLRFMIIYIIFVVGFSQGRSFYTLVVRTSQFQYIQQKCSLLSGI